MVKTGVGESLLVGMINQQRGQYVLSADEIVRLKNAGISDRMIATMIVRATAADGKPVADSLKGVGVPSERSAQTPPAPSGSIRVYVTDSQSWEIRGGWSSGGRWNAVGGSWAGGGYQAGGARPQTAEIIKTFNRRCPEITVTNRVDNADFAVTLDHEGGKGLLRRRNKMVILNRNGDDIFSDSTRELGNSVKDGCDAILRSSAPRSSNAVFPRANGESKLESVRFAVDGPPAADGLIDITFTSNPTGALVSLYGMPLGRTPFITKLAPGTYKAAFSSDGYFDLFQNISVEPGHANTVNAAFELKP